MATGFEKRSERNWKTDILVVALAVLVTHGPWLFFDIYDASLDFPLHYRWAFDYEFALRDGIILPHWAAHSRGGLGDPVFLYYVPAFYLLSAAANVFIGNLWLAIKCVVILASFACGLILLIFSRRSGASTLVARALAVAMVGGSSFLVERATINAYPKFFANIFLLLALIALCRWIQNRNPRNLLHIVVAVGLMSWTHTLTTAAFVLVAGVAMVLHWALQGRSRREFGDGLAAAGAMLLGLGLSGAAVLPAALDLDLITPVKWNEVVGSAWYTTFSWPLFHESSRGALGWMMPASTFLILPFMLGFAILIWPLDRAQRTLIWMAFLSLVMTTEMSFLIWKHVSAIQIFQWPFRFLDPLAIAVLLFLGLAASRLEARFGQKKTRLGTAFLLSLCLLPSALMEAKYILYHVTGRNLDRYVYATPALVDQFYFTPEHLPAKAGPGWEPWLAQGGWAEECNALAASCDGGRLTAHHYLWKVDIAEPATMRFPLMHFPTWRVSLNGQDVADAVDPASGLVSLPLAPGKSTVEVTWVDLPSQVLGRWISLVSLVLTAAFAVVVLRRRSH